MDIKETFIAANSALTDLVRRVRPEHLTLEAPAYARFHDGQTLRDSLNIMAYENQCVPKVLAGETGLATNPEFDGDLLGDDLAGNYERLAAEANASVRAHADLDGPSTCRTPTSQRVATCPTSRSTGRWRCSTPPP